MSVTRRRDFQQMLDAATAWARVRLTSREATALVKDFRRRGGETSWALAEAAQPTVARELASADWRAVAGAQLIACVETWFALARGRDHFLPARHAPAAGGGRWLLYLHALWHAAEGRDVDPREAVVMAIVHAHAGPLALQEVERRLSPRGHVGMWAALFVLLARWRHGGPPVADDEVTAIMKRLRRIAWQKLPAPLAGGGASFENVGAEVASEAAHTLLARYGSADPLEVVARALDGELDIMPSTIVKELVRHLTDGLPQSRKPSRQSQRKIVIDFHEPATLARVDGRAADAEQAIVDHDRLSKARRADPATFDELQRAFEKGGGKADAARALGVSRPTLDAYLRRMSRAVTGLG